jgi:hypothetical protein
MINPEDYIPDADDLDGRELGELDELPGVEYDVAKVLVEYKKEFGLMSASHGVGTFLELLAPRPLRGRAYRVSVRSCVSESRPSGVFQCAMR